MRDKSMRRRIGLLSRLPRPADLVVQGAPKAGIGSVPGCPWEHNHPIRGALQFGRGPMSWDEIHHASFAPTLETQKGRSA